VVSSTARSVTSAVHLAAPNALDCLLQPLAVEEAGGLRPDANEGCSWRDPLPSGDYRRRPRQVARIERFQLGAARLTGHPAKVLQQGDGASIRAVRAVAKKLDVSVRPSQGLRIGG